MTTPAALVWFKRDLRVRDHAPLAEAMHFEQALGLVVIEPEWLTSPECDPRHVSFLLDCVAALQRDLAARGLTLLKATLAHFPEATLTASGPLRLALIFRTTLGFKDEVIFVLDPAGQRIQFRSRSLMGRYDFGKNRSRMVAVVTQFQAEARN
jgi:hypothetical protein